MNNNQRKFLFFLYILNAFLFHSCSTNERKIVINGYLSNLPDGIVYLHKENLIDENKIDSAITKKGKFTIVHKIADSINEPLYVGLKHKANNGIIRLFDFQTNAHYLGKPWSNSLFLTDSVIKITGSIKDNPISVNSTKFKYSHITKIKGGYQTNAYFNIDGDLFDYINENTANIVQKKIEQYPNSYHLLFEIANHKNSFSAKQIKDFLKAFRGEVVSSETYKKLVDYNNKMFSPEKYVLPKLEDINGLKKEILEKKNNMHLVIFWASWCGPCIKEIPLLKEIYIEQKGRVDFVSISIDTDKEAWRNAVQKQNMPWKQLLVDKSELEALQIKFKFDESIPYVVLVDSDMNILKSYLGLINKNELKKTFEK